MCPLEYAQVRMETNAIMETYEGLSHYCLDQRSERRPLLNWGAWLGWSLTLYCPMRKDAPRLQGPAEKLKKIRSYSLRSYNNRPP